MDNLTARQPEHLPAVIGITSGGFIMIINILTLTAILVCDYAKETYIPVIKSLCVADTFTGLSLSLRMAQDYYWTKISRCYDNAGVAVYMFYVFRSNVAIFTSHWLTVVLSVDRLVAVKYALRYHAIITPRRIELMTVFAWVVGVIEEVLFSYANYYKICISETLGLEVFHIADILHLVHLLVIFAVNSVIYVQLWRVARRHRMQISHRQQIYQNGEPMQMGLRQQRGQNQQQQQQQHQSTGRNGQRQPEQQQQQQQQTDDDQQQPIEQQQQQQQQPPQQHPQQQQPQHQPNQQHADDDQQHQQHPQQHPQLQPPQQQPQQHQQQQQPNQQHSDNDQRHQQPPQQQAQLPQQPPQQPPQQQPQQNPQQPPPQQPPQQQQQRGPLLDKATVMVIVIIGLFALFWGPYFIVECIQAWIGDTHEAVGRVSRILQIGGFINAVMNNVVYVFMNGGLRRQIKKKLRCCKK